jgi:site-specific DNA-methyltransferase (adenine-specific)
MTRYRRRQARFEAPTELESVVVDGVQLDFADAADRYAHWPAPTVIIVDGPYGVGGYPGDPPTPRDLGAWYEPHAAAWAQRATPQTTLWFWGTELGWACTHATLEAAGWEYRSCHIWEKGIGHVAGNVNGDSIRRFPVTTEVCVQYVRAVRLGGLPMKAWLRAEWARTGLPLGRLNDAAGVKNAATRKWFTQDHLWYFPPPEAMEAIAAYAMEHGAPTTRPYFSLDGSVLTAAQWAPLRAKWNHAHGVTNVWHHPAVRGEERIKVASKSLHANQKPIALMERIIAASSDPGDVVWDVFGGLATGAVAARNTGRRCFSAEHNPEFFALARARLLDGRDYAISRR